MKPGTTIALAIAILFPAGVAFLLLWPGAMRATIEGLLVLLRFPGGAGFMVIFMSAFGLVGLGWAIRYLYRAETDASDRTQTASDAS